MKSKEAVPPALEFGSFTTLDQWSGRHPPGAVEDRLRRESELVPHAGDTFTVPGYCWLDHGEVDFAVDFLWGGNPADRLPNWRERVMCPKCGFNNRQRGAIHAFEQLLRPRSNARIYITEQASPVYSLLSKRYRHTIGSEYISPQTAGGAQDSRGIRHEDVTNLSFNDENLDFILSFDVFEHVPDYKRAFAECFRVLRPGGQMLFSVPFVAGSEETIVRARLAPDGTLTHHLPPEYHGDPVRPGEGVLCYQHFGWRMLDDLRDEGFLQAVALSFHSFRYGYVGGESLLFLATKAGARKRWLW